MLSKYNPHTQSQRSYSNAPVTRSSLQTNAMSNVFQHDIFSNFHREFENMSNQMMTRFDSHFSNFGDPFSSMLQGFDDDFANMGNFSDCNIFFNFLL